MRPIRHAWLAGIALAALVSAPSTGDAAADASLRSPQVPVSSSVWASTLAARHEPIDVHTQQRATQLWDFGPIGSASAAPLSFELTWRSDSVRVGIYGVERGIPECCELFSPAGPPGGFVLVRFREGDVADLYSFDEYGLLFGARRMNGISPRRVGFYAQWPSAIAYGEDARHPGARAQALSFESVVFPEGEWIGFEPRPNDGSQPRGFDDAILYFERLQPGLHALTRTWGQVKASRR